MFTGKMWLNHNLIPHCFGQIATCTGLKLLSNITR